MKYIKNYEVIRCWKECGKFGFRHQITISIETAMAKWYFRMEIDAKQKNDWSYVPISDATPLSEIGIESTIINGKFAVNNFTKDENIHLPAEVRIEGELLLRKLKTLTFGQLL